MCGILGYSGKTPFEQDKIKILYLLNETRGKHGIGLYTPINDIKRKLGKALDVIASFEIKEDNFLMGHTRQATKGQVKEENQHPFRYGDIVGLHNGTLINKDDLVEMFDVEDDEVDSKVLISCINQSNDTSVFKFLLGAAAVIFTNEKDNKEKEFPLMYVIRNSERPLHRGMIGESMYISSEKQPLEIIGCTKIDEFKTETLYEIQGGKIIGSRKLPMLSEKKIKTTTSQATCQYPNGSSCTPENKNMEFSGSHYLAGDYIDYLEGRATILEPIPKKEKDINKSYKLFYKNKIINVPYKEFSVYEVKEFGYYPNSYKKYIVNTDISWKEKGIVKLEIPKGTIVTPNNYEYKQGEYLKLLVSVMYEKELINLSIMSYYLTPILKHKEAPTNIINIEGEFIKLGNSKERTNNNDTNDEKITNVYDSLSSLKEWMAFVLEDDKVNISDDEKEQLYSSLNDVEISINDLLDIHDRLFQQ